MDLKYSIIQFSLIAMTAFGVENKYSHQVKLADSLSNEQVIQLAANVVPHKRQLAYHREEFIGFIHFGINTFTGKEWGNGMESAVAFNPPKVDTDQWCKVMKQAGMKKVIYTAKHHDGYCLWQTRYNDKFSVKTSPWKSGKGDVLRQLSKSAKKYGLKLGVYLSPADLFQIEYKDGLYGNLSKYQDSVIPTDPENFLSNPTKHRRTKKKLPLFKVKADDYNRYFMNQLYEVLTEYGKVDEVWFDGATPKSKGGQKYLKTEWFKMIRKLQPSAVIFGGPDIRWCGNEHGGTRSNEWNILPIDSEAVCGFDRPASDIGSDKMLSETTYDIYGKTYRRNSLYYVISEVDTSLRNGWFWRNDTEQNVRSEDEVFDIYERCVGGNSVFLLNVPPNKFGKFSPRDVEVMKELGRRVKSTYQTGLINLILSDKGKNLIDKKMKSYWKASARFDKLEVILPTKITTNRFSIQEAIVTVGQRVKSHALDAWLDGEWKEIARAGVIGYKRIHRFSTIKTDKFRIRILDAREIPAIAEVQAYFYKAPLRSVVVKKSETGMIEINFMNTNHHGVTSNDEGNERIIYTLNGEVPGHSSATKIYEKPFHLPHGGIVRSCTAEGEIQGALTTVVLGIQNSGWKTVVTSKSDDLHKGINAVDNDFLTHWLSNEGEKESLTIDMKKVEKVAGFSYLPRQDKRTKEGLVEEWLVEGSVNGKSWTKLDKVIFGNLLNDPSSRMFYFNKVHKFQFIRFTALKGVGGQKRAGVANISILSKKYKLK